jgi:hypothetical protein
MEFVIGYEILESYKRLSYKEWFAFAEFVDNSTQSFRNNEDILSEQFEKEGEKLNVEITYVNSSTNGFIKIADNAMGMDEEDLRRALILGKKPLNDKERSKYGLGMKTAAFWFGDVWSITTTKLGVSHEYTVRIDLHEILKAEASFYDDLKERDVDPDLYSRFIPELKIIKTEVEPSKHGTTITIEKLNRKITSSKAKKSKSYLKSIYRVDLQHNKLSLFFQDEFLTWNHEDIMNSILIDDQSGIKYYREFKFKVGEHTVAGWSGILKHGSRENAGFSLIQAERVIQGWPNSYKPALLFGDQEGGINNLVNQRLFGEIKLDGFDVSHTKDEILFKEDEESDLDEKLFNELADYKKVAQGFRVRGENGEEEVEINVEDTMVDIVRNFAAPSFRAVLMRKEVLPLAVIEKTNEEVYQRILTTQHSSFPVKIDNLEINVLISNDSSPYDPYLIIRAKPERNNLTIIFNKRHSYWDELTTKEAVYSFIKNCIYDGIAEWKAIFIAQNIDPDTIKLIKDHFLRIKMELPF